ncbi:hypothetical protein ACQJBY_002527 [Aegilops geniculata]
MAYRARKAAKEVVQGDQRAQYTRIRDYLQAVLDTNPGSRCIVTTKHLKLHPSKNPRFHGLFMCLNACKEGFLNGCRPFIGVDGCFVKLTTGQQILAATGRDGNNNIFPIAFAIVDKEDTASWSWFLTQLKYALGGESGKYGKYTIISDRQKGLLKAINNVFPNCPQRYCLRHIYQNFQTAGFRGEELKKYMDQASYLYTEHGFEQAMEGMKKECEAAWKWLRKIPKHTWARHAMDKNCKTDLVVNNISEVFNKMILDVRGKPIKTMVDGIRTKLLVKFNANRTKTETTKWQICPTYAEKLEEAKHHARYCQSIKAGPDLYQVSSGESTYAVNLQVHTCGCSKWDMTGVPCKHGVSAINKAKLHPEDFVSDFFKKPMYQAAYNPIVYPVPGPDLWPNTGTPDIEPPVFRDKPGKKQTKRRKNQFEKPAPKDTSRMATITCSNCNLTGHRYTSCHKNLKPALAMRRNQHQENRRVDAPMAAPSAPPAARARAPVATSATPRIAPPAARARAPVVARTATRDVPRAAPSAPAPTRPCSSSAAADRPSSSSATAARSRAKKTFIPPRLSGTGRVRKPSYKMSEWFNCSQGSKK